MHRAALFVNQFSKLGLQNVSDKSSSWIVVHKQSKQLKPPEGYYNSVGSRKIKNSFIDSGE